MIYGGIGPSSKLSLGNYRRRTVLSAGAEPKEEALLPVIMTSRPWEGVVALEALSIHSDPCQLDTKIGSRYHWEMACPLPPSFAPPERWILMVVSSTPARTTAAGCTETGRQNTPCNQVQVPRPHLSPPCCSREREKKKRDKLESEPGSPVLASSKWFPQRGPPVLLGHRGGLHEYRKLCRANEVTSSTRSAKHKYLVGTHCTVTPLLEVPYPP